MDIGTGLALLGGAELLKRFLGPTFDYFGEELKIFTEIRVNNVKNIIHNAMEKLGDKINEEGSVPPRVLMGVITEGSFTDDILLNEYYGGVLASSRSGISRDDRGSTFISLISTLSSYQIRTHYVLYHIAKKLFNKTSLNIGVRSERNKMKIYVPFDTYVTAMDFDEDENAMIGALVPHVVYGLVEADLLGENFAYGSQERLKTYFPDAPNPGILYNPTPLGAELFQWAFGRPDMSPTDMFDPENEFVLHSDVVIPGAYQKAQKEAET